MTTLFISDLHLHHSRPEVTECFLRFLSGAGAAADALYILGDLFESWIGDDDPDLHQRSIVEALRSFTRSGCPCYFTKGNRDMLVGGRFSQETGVTLLEERTVIELYGSKLLVMHGDELCIDDHGYQKFRRRARNPLIQRTFLALPLSVRRAIGREIRTRSRFENVGKPEEITDVNQAEVERFMQRHGISMLLHGHTHRPAVHHFQLNGTDATRIVLGDWYEQGSVLNWGSQGFELQTLPLDG